MRFWTRPGDAFDVWMTLDGRRQLRNDWPLLLHHACVSRWQVYALSYVKSLALLVYSTTNDLYNCIVTVSVCEALERFTLTILLQHVGTFAFTWRMTPGKSVAASIFSTISISNPKTYVRRLPVSSATVEIARLSLPVEFGDIIQNKGHYTVPGQKWKTGTGRSAEV